MQIVMQISTYNQGGCCSIRAHFLKIDKVVYGVYDCNDLIARDTQTGAVWVAMSINQEPLIVT